MAAPDVFMDTAGFLALWDASDAHHHRAVQLQSKSDCVSFALMHELKIQDSFTTDHHFIQAGFNPLLRNAI